MKEIFAVNQEELKAILGLMEGKKILEVDTETEGLNPHSDRWWSVQISDGETFKAVIPTNTGLEKFPEFQMILSGLEKVLTVMHNAVFDMKVLRANGCYLKDVYCTQNAEKMLTAGTYHRNNLQMVLKRRLGIDISKESRKDFYDGTFRLAHDRDPKSAWTPELVKYSFGDVGYLIAIMNQQLKEIKDWGMKDTLALELDLLNSLAKAEYNGIGIDSDGCKDFQVRMSSRAENLNTEVMSELQPLWEKAWRPEYQKDIAKYDGWNLKHKQFSQKVVAFNKECSENYKEFCREEKDFAERVDFKYEIDEAKAKFRSLMESKKSEHLKLKPFNTKPLPKAELKLRSSSAVQATFRQIGIFLPDSKKETLEQNRSEHPFIEKILEYKKYSKLAEFGELFETINSVTGRIHASINAIVSTGRMSYSAPNLQQIPSRSDEGKEFRRLFQSRKGYKFIGADFAGIELVILAVVSKESLLLDAINRGDDVHSFTMSKFLDIDYLTVFNAKESEDYPYLPLLLKAEEFQKSFDLPELAKIDKSTPQGLTKWIKSLRDYIKTISYGLAYQLSPFGMARKFNCEKETADKFIQLFFSIYPNVGNYVRSIGTVGYKKGYAETIGGRKRFFNPVKKKSYKDIEQEVESSLKKQKLNRDSLSRYEFSLIMDEAIAVHDKENRTQISAIKREAGNMPIQGTSADITKLAVVLFNQYIEDLFFPYDEGTILIVHDEIIAEVRDERSKMAAELLKKAMVNAAEEYLGKEVLIAVQPEISKFWKK